MAAAAPSGTHVPPFAADGDNSSVSQTSDYAVGNDPSGYAPEIGWAPSVEQTLDPTRTGDAVRHDRRANLRNPWAWWSRLTADENARHSVEFVDANGFEENKGSRSWAANPREIPVPESRPTQKMSPHQYVFMRPFDQEVARRFTGEHFSLAANRRNYDILTMAPVSPWRNTYRMEPTPWDTDIVDETPNVNAGHPHRRLISPDIPPGAVTRSYRL